MYAVNGRVKRHTIESLTYGNGEIACVAGSEKGSLSPFLGDSTDKGNPLACNLVCKLGFHSISFGHGTNGKSD